MYVCTIFFNLEYDKVEQRDKIRTLNFTRFRHDFHIFIFILYILFIYFRLFTILKLTHIWTEVMTEMELV